ncbi:MAG TPA: phospholipid carrier-dependent glycosyltransferase [Nitriliruptorales bacterium]
MTPAEERALELPLHPGALLRATPQAVWALVLLQLLVSVLYAIAVPLLHGPDEHAHVDLILNVSDHLGTDPYAGLEFDRRTFTAMARRDLVAVDWRSSPVFPWEGLEGGAAPLRAHRPTYEQLVPSGPVGVPNTANTHPPLYYAVADGAAAVVRAVLPVRWTWDRHVTMLRIVSAALVAPLPLLAFWTAFGLTRRRRVALTAALVPLAVPQLTHIAGTVNNDDLLFLLTAALTLVLSWVVRGDRSLGTAVAAGALAGAGVLTKVFALPAPLWIVAAYALAWRQGLRPRDALTRVGVAGVATVVLGGWWVLRQLVVHGTPAPRPFLYDQPAGLDTGLVRWLGTVLDRMPATFWGRFGVEHLTLPGWLIVAASLVLLAVLLAAYTAPDVGAPPLTVLVLPAATTLAMVLWAAWGGYVRSGLPTGLHGRYLFVGMVGIALLWALGADRLVGGLALPATAIVALVLQAAGLATVTGSYWEGPGVLGDVAAAMAWAPWRARWSILLVLATAAAGVVAAVGVRRDAKAPT